MEQVELLSCALPFLTTNGIFGTNGSDLLITSGHKYGLVYPGIGWLIFRDIEDLDSEVIFHVNYLGQTENSYTLNFSKPASGIIAQYYNFIRLGSEGYKSIMESILENAQYLSKKITDSGKFKLLEAKTILPIVTFQLVKD